MPNRAEKEALRRRALERRCGLAPEIRARASAAITRHLREIVGRLNWRLISCYMDFDAEVRTEDFVRQCLLDGVRVALPYVGPGSRLLYMSEVRNLDTELSVNRYGIREPKREFLRPLPVGALEAIVVPGTAFDSSGARLGYGLGFYDRVLAQVRGTVPLIGLAFDNQMVEKLPVEKHDVPMDMVITESGIFRVSGLIPSSTATVPIEEVL